MSGSLRLAVVLYECHGMGEGYSMTNDTMTT